MQMLFHGETGPFQIQRRLSMDPDAPWVDVPHAKVTKLNTGVFLAVMPIGDEDATYYRIESKGETIAELQGWSIYMTASEPANGEYFTPGEAPVVTVTVLDTFAGAIGRDDFSTLNLYMYGPQDPRKSVTPAKLMNASEDRSQRPHHYIDLRTNPDVQVEGQVYTYPLQAVTDEEPGTYRIGLIVKLGDDVIQQVVRLTDIQIGTATVEEEVVAKYAPDGTPKCAACHEGTVSGKMYLHHIDPSSRSPIGSWSYDFNPVSNCKLCHNNDGYAAFRAPDSERIPDPIVRRVHGIHNGAGLQLPFHVDPDTGDFRDYLHVDLPADIRNCTKCHIDDRWKTTPSRLACGACHDSTWFGTFADLPADMTPHYVPQPDDQHCSFCHKPDSGGFEWDGKDMAVAAIHAIPNPADNRVELAMSQPANGTHYVDGEAPQLTIKFQKLDSAGIPTGMYVDPAGITDTTWNRLRLQVSGPRALTFPALTTASSDHSRSGSASYIYNDLRLRSDPMEDDPRATRTSDSIIYQLETISDLTDGSYTVFVQGRTNGNSFADLDFLNFQVGTETPEKKIATSCKDCHDTTKMHGSYPFEPDLCKSCHDYQNQLAGKSNWNDSNWGFGAAPLSRRVHGLHYGNYVDKPFEIHARDGEHFQHIIFPMDIRNCTKCHSESPTWSEKPNRLACLACHDSDDAILHGALMTWDPTPAEPYNGDEAESCNVCHGKGKDFSADKVHSLADPYVPLYQRAPR